MAPVDLKALRVDVIGSLQRPAMLKLAYARHAEGKLSAQDLHQAQDEAILEAITTQEAHGLPVVASRTGGIPEIVSPDETGELIDTAAPGWEAAARQAVMALQADPERRNRLGTQARAFAAAHGSSDNMVARTAAIYREILAVCAGESQ